MKALFQKPGHTDKNLFSCIRIPVSELETGNEFTEFPRMGFTEFQKTFYHGVDHNRVIRYTPVQQKKFRKEIQEKQTSTRNKTRIFNECQHTAITPVRIKERLSI